MNETTSVSYITLVDELKKQKQWAMVQMLEDKDPSARLREVRALFLSMATSHDDEQAMVCYGWLKHAIEDSHLSMFFEKSGTKTLLQQDVGVDRARENALRAQLNEAVVLWPLLPTHQTGQRKVVDQDEWHTDRCKVVTLPKTKYFVLNSIAYGWRETKDEKKADELFELFASAGSYYEDDRKLILSVVREATNSSFPANRLARHHTWIAGRLLSSQFACELARILAVGFVRNTSYAVLSEIFKATLPILTDGQGQDEQNFGYLTKAAKRLAELQGKLVSLRESLTDKVVKIKINTLEVIQVSEIYRLGGTAVVAQDQFEAWHEELCETVRQWQNEGGVGAMVTLEVFRADQADEPIFRKQAALAYNKAHALL